MCPILSLLYSLSWTHPRGAQTFADRCGVSYPSPQARALLYSKQAEPVRRGAAFLTPLDGERWIAF
ncbi:MAG: hypothetical protein HY726_21240 [Candidatus Rokubacteria bacterium]|nr:hypothetical protein [Candidatus Rokubacteria bacterium]